MSIWKFISSKLKSHIEVILLVVIDSEGSSPGRKGFKMAVCSDGQNYGSIGGGTMEYNMVELAREQFEENRGIFSMRQEHASEAEQSSGMICSGNQHISFYPIDRTQISLIDSIAKAEKGKLIFNDSGIVFEKDVAKKGQFTEIKSEIKWTFSEPAICENHLYIFGAGHVGLAVSQVFKQLGFRITVFDDRNTQLSTYQGNHYADFKMIINYANVSEYIPEGEHVYVLIMTHAHTNDGKVLEQLIHKKVKYLGMMGSESKVAAIYKEMKTKGFTNEMLSEVDAPVGIPINSKTPEEIAISIAAKIIKEKNTEN